MLIVAIDPATNTGVCEGVVGQTPTLSAQRFRVRKDEDVEELFGRAVAFFAGFLMTRSPDLVVIEAPIRVTGDTNDATTTLTRGLYGALVGVALAKGLPFKRASISTWRAYTLFNGRIGGPEAKRQCMTLCSRMGWHAPTHDAAEAAGIWLWACSQVDPVHTQRHEPLLIGRPRP